jgi:hypothetical protein
MAFSGSLPDFSVNPMNTSHLIGQSVQIKLAGVPSPFSAVILGSEAAGLWVHKGDIIDKIAVDQGSVSPGLPQDPAVFLPFTTISWLITAMKEALYQKAR